MEKIYKKIKKLDELACEIKNLKKQGKKVVHCHGVFDLIHPGHIRHLASAKKEGDILVVTITADEYVRKGPGRPIFNENLRAETLAAMENVDYVAINDAPTAVNCIKMLMPSVYVKGQDYIQKDKDVTGKINDEEEAILSVGGGIVFTDDITFSSSKLINEHLEVFPDAVRKYLKKISEKHSIDSIIKSINSVKNLKVLVIGDAIIDQYHYCETMGTSLKGQIVVTKSVSEEFFAGGVFATANNVAALCGKVDLVTVLGDKDNNQQFIDSHLSTNITAKYFYRADSPTTVKRRFVDSGNNKKMFEICLMNDFPISSNLENDVLGYLEEKIANYDLVIVSDFGHGFLNKRLIAFICKNSKFLAVNVQTNSANTGFNLTSKYPRADYVSIDEPEIRLAMHEKHMSLDEVMEMLLQKFDYKNLIVTRGKQGSLFYSKETDFIEAPALASKVIDTVGAGDAFFAYTAPLIAAGIAPEVVSFAGNAVGALAVQIVCNRNPVDVVDLLKFITRLLK
ncbi:hypothetical protein A3J90_07435 [candidate division WOR-1 bacterium RIFOXYC2_FULL_37_10]|uniref:Cytidyltransferase n=1 Tax=candidate division WOR-1 bacterium RIFOXYB2_FULL_37_13 TaxID=1802579 RepID=A0A1F4SQH7_UNCSA|nr:MAG: hypothetical protein A2246_03905 [candidate division WOR-1 bacterium RIFOXYA2_FULL_37_7]OGC22685.1 MAG: hypothetical protein A2310_07740 [candidate division WOR-1 bacterium RIFOXYB2_FULL_37_13]OGC36285.1 MAG: hypothetical protein A3J90_07435 [candidate division WOR-1 bacterium RIFOXYC2_FULL_37_10]